MSAKVGFGKILEALVDVAMVPIDVAHDFVKREGLYGKTGKRLKRIVNRTADGAKELYENSEGDDQDTTLYLVETERE